MSRAATARALLHAAEQRHGITSLSLVSTVPPDKKASGKTPAAAGWQRRPAFAVPAALTGVLPHGLARGAVCSVTGSTTVLLALAAQVSAQDGWVAFVGTPDINFVAALELGMNLDRVVLVPDLAGSAPEAMATLIDGMDLVVVGAALGLTAGQQSRLAARARERGTTLLVAGTWPRAQVHLFGRPGRWQGAHQGLGRLTTCQYHVRSGTDAHGFSVAEVRVHNGRLQVAQTEPVGAAAPLRLVGA